MKAQKTKTSKGPRLCPEDRLRRRFYEPLILLNVLDRNGGHRISRCPSVEGADSQLDLRELRRTFLNQLAYVCDHIMGGDTVTAIALEAQSPGVTFWVASNNNPSEGTIYFLQRMLETLRNLTSSRIEQSQPFIENKITERCIEINFKRIRSYQTIMRRPLQLCLESLKSSKASEDKTLAQWLEKFQGFKDNLIRLCRFSYEQRASRHLRALQRHIGDEPPELTYMESTKQAFLLTRHYIGRLGSHVKAAKVLIAAGYRMPGLFESFTIRTRFSSKPSLLPPDPDDMTTLDGILKRMLPADSENLSQYQEALADMDSKFKIQDRFLAQYQAKDFRPRVHAELILLEFFYATRRPFIDNDRFIGCSKPACYCCYHYISLHPGGFVRPSSHGIRYTNWRPPDLVNAADIREKHLQRDVMNRLIAQIRLDALRHIEQRRGPSPGHPGSTTGITYSQNFDGSVAEVDNEEEGSWTPDGRQTEGVVPAYSAHLELSASISADSDSDSDGGVSLSTL